MCDLCQWWCPQQVMKIRKSPPNSQMVVWSLLIGQSYSVKAGVDHKSKGEGQKKERGNVSFLVLQTWNVSRHRTEKVCWSEAGGPCAGNPITSEILSSGGPGRCSVVSTINCFPAKPSGLRAACYFGQSLIWSTTDTALRQTTHRLLQLTLMLLPHCFLQGLTTLYRTLSRWWRPWCCCSGRWRTNISASSDTEVPGTATVSVSGPDSYPKYTDAFAFTVFVN